MDNNGSKLFTALRYQIYMTSALMIFPIKRLGNQLFESNGLRVYSFLLLFVYLVFSIIVFHTMVTVSSKFFLSNGYVWYTSMLMDFLIGRISTIFTVVYVERNTFFTIQYFRQMENIDAKLSSTIKVNVNYRNVFWRTFLISTLTTVYFLVIVVAGSIRNPKVIEFNIFSSIRYMLPYFIDQMCGGFIIITCVNYAIIIKSKFRTLNNYMRNEWSESSQLYLPIIIELYAEILETMCTFKNMFGPILVIRIMHDLIAATSATYTFLSLLMDAKFYLLYTAGVWIVQCLIKIITIVWFLDAAVSEVGIIM